MGVVACVGPNKFQPWKALADLVEDEDRATAVLNASRMDDHMQRQAFDINEGVYLVALHLLAGVVAHCVLFTPARGFPLSAAFSDWLSMIAAVGLTGEDATEMMGPAARFHRDHARRKFRSQCDQRLALCPPP
jgi:hypothetical protein